VPSDILLLKEIKTKRGMPSIVQKEQMKATDENKSYAAAKIDDYNFAPKQQQIDAKDLQIL
jgi:hypothetical protein